MEVSESTATRTFVPTAEQHDRAVSLRRFNLMFVYGPIALGVLIVLALIILLIIGALAPDLLAFGGRTFDSALADTLVILMVLPLVALGAAVSVGLLALVLRAEWRRRQKPLDEQDRLRVLLWKVGGILDSAAAKLETWAPRVARPFVVGGGYLAFSAAFARFLRHRLLRR